MSVDLYVGLHIDKGTIKAGCRGHLIYAIDNPHGPVGTAMAPPFVGVLEIEDRSAREMNELITPHNIHHEATEAEQYLGLIFQKQWIKQRWRVDFDRLPVQVAEELEKGRSKVVWADVRDAVIDDWEDEKYCYKEAKPDTTEMVKMGLLERIVDKKGFVLVRDALEKFALEAARAAELAKLEDGPAKDALLASQKEILVAKNSTELEPVVKEKVAATATCASADDYYTLCKQLDTVK